MEKEILQQILNKLDKLEQDVQSLREITLRIEYNHGKQLQGLFDGYTANYEIIERFDPRVTLLEHTVERLNFEVQHLKDLDLKNVN